MRELNFVSANKSLILNLGSIPHFVKNGPCSTHGQEITHIFLDATPSEANCKPCSGQLQIKPELMNFMHLSDMRVDMNRQPWVFWDE